MESGDVELLLLDGITAIGEVILEFVAAIVEAPLKTITAATTPLDKTGFHQLHFIEQPAGGCVSGLHGGRMRTTRDDAKRIMDDGL